MSDSFDIHFGESVFCTELNTGENRSGNFLYAEDGITTTLVSFDGFFYVKPDAPVFLMTEKLKVVSLYDSFGAPPGKSSRNIEPVREVHIQKLFSNTAIVGDDEWKPDDRVKRVSFQINNSMELLRNQAKIERLSMDRRSEDDEEDDWLLLNFKVGAMTVRLFYTASYQMWGNEPKDVNPRFELEFDEAVRLGDYSAHMQRVVFFCSLAAGVPLVPSEIRISRQSLDEFLDDVKNNRAPTSHRALYRWPEFDIGSSEVRVYGLPFFAFGEDELVNLGNCLRVWLERGQKWDNSYSLMMGALVRRNEVSPERLLNACKWLEELPNASPQRVIDSDMLKRISAAAIEFAEASGVTGIGDRISGSLNQVGLESRDQHFRRLLQEAWNGYSLPRSIEDMTSDLKGSQNLRGKAAHGHLSFNDEDGFRKCSRFTKSLEALCLLLTLRDLPLSREGRQRVMSHRIIEDYRFSY